MKNRMIVVTVETLLEIIRDYLGEDNIPEDATVSKLMVNQSEKGRFAVEFESPTMREGLAPLNVHFDIRRFHALGS